MVSATLLTPYQLICQFHTPSVTHKHLIYKLLWILHPFWHRSRLGDVVFYSQCCRYSRVGWMVLFDDTNRIRSSAKDEVRSWEYRIWQPRWVESPHPPRNAVRSTKHTQTLTALSSPDRVNRRSDAPWTGQKLLSSSVFSFCWEINLTLKHSFKFLNKDRKLQMSCSHWSIWFCATIRPHRQHWLTASTYSRMHVGHVSVKDMST